MMGAGPNPKPSILSRAKALIRIQTDHSNGEKTAITLLSIGMLSDRQAYVTLPLKTLMETSRNTSPSFPS